MRVIIAGGSGLIGRALSASLLADGHEVIVLTRNPARVKDAVSGVQLAQWDAKSAAGWAQQANGAYALVNLAGESIAGDSPLSGRWSAGRKQAILQSRLDAGAAMLDALRQVQQRPAVLVQASGIDYYPPRSDDSAVTESASPATSWIGRVVYAWEASTAAAAGMGVRRPVMRTGIVLSTAGGALPLMKLPFDLLVAGGPLGSGKQIMPWIHIDDQVRAIRFLIENEQADGAFNLCAPNAVTNTEFAHTLGSVMGRPAIMPTPGFAIKAALGEMADILLLGRRAVPAHLQALGFTFTWPDLKPALEALLKKAPR